MQAVSSVGSMSGVAAEDLCWLCCANPVPVMLAALEEADLPAQGSVNGSLVLVHGKIA